MEGFLGLNTDLGIGNASCDCGKRQRRVQLLLNGLMQSRIAMS